MSITVTTNDLHILPWLTYPEIVKSIERFIKKDVNLTFKIGKLADKLDDIRESTTQLILRPSLMYIDKNVRSIVRNYPDQDEDHELVLRTQLRLEKNKIIKAKAKLDQEKSENFELLTTYIDTIISSLNPNLLRPNYNWSLEASETLNDLIQRGKDKLIVNYLDRQLKDAERKKVQLERAKTAKEKAERVVEITQKDLDKRITAAVTSAITKSITTQQLRSSKKDNGRPVTQPAPRPVKQRPRRNVNGNKQQKPKNSSKKQRQTNTLGKSRR
jgi:hypothetical protein